MKIGNLTVRFSLILLVGLCHLDVWAGGNLITHNPADPLQPTQVRWDERMMPIKWVLSRDGYPGSGITNAQLENELIAAFTTWESISTSNITFSYQGQVDRRTSEVDGYQLITFTDPETEFAPGVVGLAQIFSFHEETVVDDTNNDLDGNGTQDIPNGTYPAGTIFDGNILFNSSVELRASGTQGTLDIRAIALHEIGHFIGLSHSSIAGTVMWPFINPDIEQSRQPAVDDVAYVSLFYPKEPEFSAVFGNISGKVTNGFDNNRILGAHVYAVDIESGEKLVGAYTGVDGSYVLPVHEGSYFVGIEPLDGDPIALDPQRINEIIANTFDTSFTEELFDANESNIESDPLAAIPVSVSAGTTTPDINIQTNTVNVPGVSRVLVPGINYFSYPVAVPEGLTAFDLIKVLGDSTEINALERLNPQTQLFERVSYVDGVPGGINFSIRRGEGYIVHAKKQKAVSFSGVPDCPRISLQTGMNLIGVPCPPSTYSAFDLLTNLGSMYEVQSVKRFNPLDPLNFQTAAYSASVPSGDDFYIVNGEAYFVEMHVDKNDIRVPGNANLFPPAITGISPGRGVPGEFILVTGEGFDADIQKNIITFNGVGAPIIFATPSTIAVSIPANATSGPVKVIANDRESNSIDFIIQPKNIQENSASTTPLLAGQVARGSLATENEQDRYSFLGAKGAVVTIRAETLSGADLLLALEGPSGVLLMSDDDSGGASNPVIRNFVLPEAGHYTAVVTSVAGTGAYDLFLEIRSTSSEPAVSVLQGDAQSALAGTGLPKPLEVFVTSGIGKPLAGVPVTFTATDVDVVAPSQGFALQNAGTTVITTNSNGIATIQATAPNASGVYDITVTVPGMEPVTMQVSATPTAVARAVISKQVEDCGGAGCPVNEKLPAPYVIQYFDSNDQPVENVLTSWKVVSGGGTLSDFTPAGNGRQVTGPDGRVEVFHTLGQKVFADLNGRPTKVPLMQAVAATVAGYDAPVLFSAISKAGAPAKIEGLNSNFSRLTYGTSGLNAIRLRVTDQFDNPVKGAVIDAGDSDLEVAPGQLDSVPLQNYETNEDGIWIGAVQAFQVTPTLDEFGNAGAAGLAAPYNVVVSHPTAGSLSYIVDVDMGPEMVTQWGQAASALITKELEQPLAKIVMRYQRIDTFEDIGDGVDDDNGDWTDENFERLRQIPIEGVAIQFTASRVDGFKEEDSGLTATKINGQDEVTLVTNAQGIAEATISLTEVGGAISILGEIFTPVIAQLETDTGDALGSPVEYPLENYNRETTGILAVPVTVEVAMDAERASGIDWSTFVVSLNGTTTIFDGGADMFPPLNKFPNFFRLFIDGAELLEWPSAEVLASGEFSELKLVYQPVGSELVEGQNSLAINADIENFGSTATQLNEQEVFTFSNDVDDAQWALARVLNSAWEVDFGLNKTISLAQMQNRGVPAAGAGELTIGDYEVFHIPLVEPSSVKVELLDSDKQLVETLFDEPSLPGVSHSFVLLQKDIDSRIVRMADKPDLHVRIISTSLANGQVREVLYRGELQTSTTGKMLGQVIQHDVLIQDGSLNLRREDLALQGAGPQLNFIRSYSNARSPENENGVFGTGWSHNHEIFAKVLAWSDGAPTFENNLPGWIAQTRLTAQPKLMTSMEFASILPDPANKSPSMIAISNGGVFERDANGNWIGQRGNHGSLGGSLASGYVYTSKDGTHYQFASATDPYGRFPVMVISDRNGNALTYTYEQIEINENLEGADFVYSPLEYKLTRVTDQAGRYLDFQYARADNGFVRLTSVRAVVGGAASENIQLNFEYYKRKSSDSVEVANRFDVVGMLREFSRENFTETYEYDRVDEDGQPNLVSVIDANGHKTAYQYHADVPVDFLSVAPGTVLTDLVQKVCYPTELAANLCTEDFAEFDYSLADGNQRVVKDLRANSTIYTLNRWGNPAKVEEPEGKTTEFEWSIDRNEADNVMRFKRDVSMDAQWEYQYDAKGNLTLEIDPFGEETSQVWHPLFAVLESRTDKNGNQLERELDGQGNVLSETRTATVDGVPTSVTVTHHYSNVGGFKNLREWTENGRGYRTTFTYDDNGNLESATQPADATTGAAIATHYEFNHRGLKTKTIDPSGNATEWRYDSLDRLEWQIDAEGNTQQIAYDDKGNKDWEESVDRYFIGDTQHTRVLKLDYTYDARDRVTDIIRTGSLDGATLDTNGNPLIGGARAFAYDGNSNITSESDWLGRATTHKYDGLNRRSETTNRDQKIMSYDYDFRSTAGSVLQKGLRKITTDYNGNPTTEYFDVLNRLYRVEHPTVYAHSTSGGAEEAVNYVRAIEYDKLDNVLAVTDEDGNRTQYEYDGRYLKTAQINALSDRYTWHYDANGNLSRTIDEAGRETAYEYDAQDRLTTKSQPEGHLHRYVEYQPNGALKKEIDPWGFEYSYTYNKLNHKISVTHPEGQDILRYTKDGQLAYRKDAENRTESNLFGPDSRLLVSTDARGRTTANSYDHNGNITDTVLAWDQATTGETRVATHTEYDLLDRKHKVHEAFGTPLERVTTYTYDNQSNLTQVHVPDENNPDGQVTSYIYDELNRVKTTVAPQTTNYAKAAATIDDLETQSLQRHNGAGKVVWLKDRRGNTTSTQYDALQRADVITDALGNTIDHEYDKVGNLRFIKDKRGNVRETVYDELNRVTHQYINMLTDPSAHTLEAGSTRQFRLLTNRYDTTGFASQERVNEVVDAENNTVISSLDWRGNVLTQTLPAGDNYPATTVVNTYDKSGWLTNSKTGELTETQNQYFADGTLQSLTRVQKISGLEDEVTNYQYDIFGNQALVLKPKQNQQTSTYDARNRLALVEDDLGNQTRFEYDLNNNLLRQYQPAANDSSDENLVEYIYDERNQKRAHIQHKADGNLTTLYDYDAAGNLAQQQDAKGQVFGYQYDALNRLHIQNFPAGGDITSIVTTYDANGNLDVVTENKPGSVVEITDHNYDLLDRLESKIQRGHVVSYTYDNNGNRLTVTSPGGTTTNTFDTRNRLDTVTTASGTTVYTYLPTGWTDIVTHANGTKVDYDYDSIGRPLKILNRAANDEVLSQFDYQYDLNGNRTQQIEIQNGFANAAERTRTTDYVYDDLDRLESFTHTQGTSTESHTYTYYPSYDRKTEIVVKDGTTLKSRTFTYDETHWIKTITEAAGTGGVITYTYDNNGNSTAKTDTTGEGPASTLFTYNSRNQLVGVAAGNTGSEVGKGAYHYNYQGMRIRHLGSARGDIEYLYDDKSIIDELGNSTTTQVAHYSYGDRLLSLTSGGAEQFYHYAALGTTANLTNSSGQNQIAYRLDPFGEITQQEGTSLNRQVFTGHEHDTETGLIYMKARFYDPAVGRFINQDTYLGESTTPPSLHRYLYAYGNPLVYVDPDGHSPLMMDPGMQRAMLELIPDQRMKDVAVQHWEFEQRATAPMAAGIAVQTGSDLLSGAMDTAEYINNVMYSPISSRHRAKAAETTSGFIEGIDQLISSRGMTVVDGLLASHNRAVESVEQGEFYRAGKESASIAQIQLSVATVGLSAPLAAKSGVDVLKAGVRTSKAKTSASVTSEANVGPLDSAVDVVGQGDRFVPDNIRYEKYWDDLGQTPASLSNRETRAWYLSKEMEIPGLLDTSKSLEYQAKQAFEIRNDLRAGARDLMTDQKAADYLRMNEPNLTWEELVTIKSVKYSGDDLWNSIISSSQKSRESVNTQFNFIGDRPRYD